jgi:hypothetical protein
LCGARVGVKLIEGDDGRRRDGSSCNVNWLRSRPIAVYEIKVWIRTSRWVSRHILVLEYTYTNHAAPHRKCNTQRGLPWRSTSGRGKQGQNPARLPFRVACLGLIVGEEQGAAREIVPATRDSDTRHRTQVIRTSTRFIYMCQFICMHICLGLFNERSHLIHLEPAASEQGHPD